MPIVSHPANKAFRDHFDETFGPKPKRPNECRIYNTECPTPELCRLAEPDAPCCAGQVNDDTGEGSMTLAELEKKLEEAPGCECRVPGPGNGNSKCMAPLRAVCQCACHSEQLFDCSYCTHKPGATCGCICHTKAP